ncbi:DUF3047 domain-containing protein [Desulfobulbus alkaliphilus]|uniref:DUF3047 domain-containing protein n=1 Tax=Desulfobulbus alkaliphilus TaxID=869814 RepID=UPI0019669890|nr:DUF3047 domain-containing protein [Desulfobulbus alkaliphilus]MBM9538305.1 DUF3047 domain-containing protein [Desulfobulbus alkaliphilus]
MDRKKWQGMMATIVLAGAALWPVGPIWAESERITVLIASDLSEWEEKSFQGSTEYSVVDSGTGPAVRAFSNGSASGLFRKVNVDLHRTPFLHWSWRIENVLDNDQEWSKAGDDYAARIYVVFSGGALFWRTRALNYVWSSHQEVGSVWPNAYTSNAIMIAQQSGDGLSGRWVTESRNVLADAQRLLGSRYTHLDAIAIMTDTDDTGQQAVAYYGDIYFSGEHP